MNNIGVAMWLTCWAKSLNFVALEMEHWNKSGRWSLDSHYSMRLMFDVVSAWWEQNKTIK